LPLSLHALVCPTCPRVAQRADVSGALPWSPARRASCPEGLLHPLLSPRAPQPPVPRGSSSAPSRSPDPQLASLGPFPFRLHRTDASSLPAPAACWLGPVPPPPSPLPSFLLFPGYRRSQVAALQIRALFVTILRTWRLVIGGSQTREPVALRRASARATHRRQEPICLMRFPSALRTASGSLPWGSGGAAAHASSHVRGGAPPGSTVGSGPPRLRHPLAQASSRGARRRAPLGAPSDDRPLTERDCRGCTRTRAAGACWLMPVWTLRLIATDAGGTKCSLELLSSIEAARCASRGCSGPA
jgi:hypothetical protein